MSLVSRERGIPVWLVQEFALTAEGMMELPGFDCFPGAA